MTKKYIFWFSYLLFHRSKIVHLHLRQTMKRKLMLYAIMKYLICWFSMNLLYLNLRWIVCHCILLMIQGLGLDEPLQLSKLSLELKNPIVICL